MAETLAYDIIARDVNASRTFDHVGDSIGDAAKQSHQFTTAQKALSTQISDTETRLKGLIRQIDGSENKELFKAIRKDQSMLAFLKRAERQLKDAGESGGREFTKGFGDALSSIPSQLKGAGIVGAVSIAPFIAAPIGAAIGGAVLGGLGVGGIVGGVAAAAQDQRIKDYGERLGENFLGGFKDAGRIFIAPLLDQMSTLQHAEDVFIADAAKGFASLAPLIRPLAKGLEGFAENLNLDQAFGDALPALRAIANEMPEIGDAIGDALHSIGEESDGATMGLVELLHITEDAIRGTGTFIAVLSDLFEKEVKAGYGATLWAENWLDGISKVTQFLGPLGVAVDFARDQIGGLNDEDASLLESLGKAKDAGDDWTGSLADQARSAKEAADEAKQYTDALEKLFGIQMSIDEAQIGYQKAIDETLKTLKEGKRTLDINTEDGRENKEAILDQVKAIEDLRRANINNKMEVADANKIADDQLNILRITAERLGFSKTKVDELINAYINLKRNAYVETHVEDKSVQIAYGHVKAVETEMDRLNGNVSTIYVRTVFGEYRAGERNPSGRATGGGVDANTMYWVGENGPELVSFSRSGRVYPAGQSRAMAAAAAPSTSQAAPIQLIVSAKPGAQQALAEVIIPLIQFEVGTAGAGDVNYLAGRR